MPPSIMIGLSLVLLTVVLFVLWVLSPEDQVQTCRLPWNGPSLKGLGDLRLASRICAILSSVPAEIKIKIDIKTRLQF